MPGAPLLHGYQTSASPAGEGGSARVAAAAMGTDLKTSDLQFFVWVLLLGVILPGLILGGLKAGGFQFVFRSR